MGKSSNRSHQSEVPSLLSSVADILENGVLGVFGASNEKVTDREPFSQADHVFKGVEGTELASTDTASDEIDIKTHPRGIAMSRSSSLSSDDMPELDRLGESTCNSSSGENTRGSGEVREFVVDPCGYDDRTHRSEAYCVSFEGRHPVLWNPCLPKHVPSSQTARFKYNPPLNDSSGKSSASHAGSRMMCPSVSFRFASCVSLILV